MCRLTLPMITQKFRQLLLYGGLEREQYKAISSAINESNRKSIVVLSTACMLFYALRLCLKYSAVPDTNRIVFLGVIVLFTLLCLSQLAEDNALNEEIARAVLSEAGFVVTSACDGAAAVEALQNAPAGTYDLILMDIQMPRLNGYEAARKIRALPDPARAQIPIIAMTADAFEEDRQNALAAGMNAHITKPIEIPKLLKVLAEFL